jgi:hypothetical protein
MQCKVSYPLILFITVNHSVTHHRNNKKHSIVRLGALWFILASIFAGMKYALVLVWNYQDYVNRKLYWGTRLAYADTKALVIRCEPLVND